MKAFSSFFPFPPTINHVYGQRGNRRFIKKAGLKYIETVKATVQSMGWSEPLTGRLKYTFRVWMPDRRRRDGDNLQKFLQDCLTKAGVYKDDCQIRKWDIEVLDKVIKGGKVCVQVEEWIKSEEIK